MGNFEHAEWSDKFFNYVPAEQAFDEEWREANEDREILDAAPLSGERLLEVAKQFLEAYPDCPMTADQLVEDFLRRL